MNDLKALGAIASTAVATIGTEVAVATISTTVPAAGIAGFFGFTTIATTVVTLPVGGVVAAAGLLGFGIYKGVELARKQSRPQS